MIFSSQYIVILMLNILFKYKMAKNENKCHGIYNKYDSTFFVILTALKQYTYSDRIELLLYRDERANLRD